MYGSILTCLPVCVESKDDSEIASSGALLEQCSVQVDVTSGAEVCLLCREPHIDDDRDVTSGVEVYLLCREPHVVTFPVVQRYVFLSRSARR